MNFAELRDEVFTWTKRPDLVSATNSAIRRNTFKYHRIQPWYRDLVVLNEIPNPTPDSPVVVVDIPTTFPRFRRFAEIRITGQRKPLTPMEVNNELDLDGYSRTKVYLIAGTNLNIKWYSGFPTFDVAYYQDPIAIETGYTSWIATDYPDLIICASAAEVLAFDNESEIYKAAKMTEAEQYKLLLSNSLEMEAR